MREKFQTVHVLHMDRYQQRHMVLLLDFDEMANRRDEVAKVVPPYLHERVFVFGVWSEPKKFRKAGLGSLESVGSKLAQECKNETNVMWDHEQLRHNNNERVRITAKLKHHLFE